jgi:hypothetical protein
VEVGKEFRAKLELAREGKQILSKEIKTTSLFPSPSVISFLSLLIFRSKRRIYSS